MTSIHLRAVALTALALAALAFAAACGGDDDDAPATATALKAATSAATSGGGSNVSTSSTTVNVVLTENKLTPDKLSVPVGETVTFALTNEGAAVHNMKILSAKQEGKDFTSEALINPGKESKFTAKFTKKGTYKFQCDYHLPDMVGTIEVK